MDVLETICAEGRGWKVEIARRDDGLFQVMLLRWIEETVPGYGKVAEFWEEQSSTISITDSIENARELARDLLTSKEPRE